MWKLVHRQGGATVYEKVVGSCHASVFKVETGRYVYNVTKPGARPFHKRGTVSSLASAKAAASRLIAMHCGTARSKRR